MMANPTLFVLLSLAGMLFATVGSLISALAYRGKNGERYSPLNHFISELGEVGVSKLALAFNLGLILSGLSLIPACFVLGSLIPGFLAKVGMITGLIAALSLALVGVFPMNNIKPHGIAAVTFFRFGLLMVSTFSIAIAVQPQGSLVLPRLYSLAGLPAILAFSSFLILMRQSTSDNHDPLEPTLETRPKVCLMTVVEWAIFLTIILWFLLVAVGLGM